jgi:signal transduction histidine kinase/CheY-like chemotaxis protein
MTKISLYFIGILICNSIFAKNKSIVIEKDRSEYLIKNYISVLEDKKNKFEIQYIIENDTLFKPCNNLNNGFTSSAYWYQFSIHNPTDKTATLIAGVSYPDLNVLDFYETCNKQILNTVQTGENRPFKSRVLAHRNYLFPLNIPPQSSRSFYLKAFNHGDTVNLPITLKEQTTFFLEDQLHTIFYWIFYGVYLLVISLNLFLFLVSKMKLYLFYVMYAFFITYFILNLDGISYQLFWPNSPWWSSHSTILFANMANLFLLLLAQHFLNVQKFSKKWMSIIHLFKIIWCLGISLTLFNQSFLTISIYLLNISLSLSIVFIIVLSIKSFLKGNILAIYFTIGFVMLFISLLVFQLTDTGVIQQSFFSNNAIKIGLISEGICLTLAMIDRYRREIVKINHILEIKNESLVLAQNDAENANQLKGVFLSNMSHEIRSPLHIINGYIQLFQREKITQAEQATVFDIMIQNAKVLLQLIDDIVDISKIEANQLQLNYNYCKLPDFFTEIYSDFKDKKPTVSLRIETPFPSQQSDFFYTDSLRLKQILTNLLINAFKFTTKGEVTIGYSKQENGILFFVKDTGKGIPPDRTADIFSRFNKLDQSDGTGLGLSICKELVTLLGGEIEVDSTPNVGSSFYFSLPIVKSPEESSLVNHLPQQEQPQIHYNWEGKTMLIAEDNKAIFLLLKKHFKDTHVILMWAKNGIEAIDTFCSSNKIDLILMDINMPLMNGFDALKAIRQIDPDIPVFAQTAYGLNNEIEQCKQAGFSEYIPKPVDLNIISLKINKYFIS